MGFSVRTRDHSSKRRKKIAKAYSNLKHLLMQFYSDHFRFRDFKENIAPRCSVLMPAFGIPAEGGSDTYSLKEEGQNSTTVWDALFRHQ